MALHNEICQNFPCPDYLTLPMCTEMLVKMLSLSLGGPIVFESARANFRTGLLRTQNKILYKLTSNWYQSTPQGVDWHQFNVNLIVYNTVKKSSCVFISRHLGFHPVFIHLFCTALEARGPTVLQVSQVSQVYILSSIPLQDHGPNKISPTVYPYKIHMVNIYHIKISNSKFEMYAA